MEIIILKMNWNTTEILSFDGHFSRWTWISRYQNVSILDILELTMMEVVITGALKRSKLQSDHHHQQTNN